MTDVDTILTLMANDTRRSELRARGMRAMRERFSEGRVMSRLERWLEEQGRLKVRYTMERHAHCELRLSSGECKGAHWWRARVGEWVAFKQSRLGREVHEREAHRECRAVASAWRATCGRGTTWDGGGAPLEMRLRIEERYEAVARSVS